MTNFFQSVGITISILVFIAITLVLMYMSYILGIGLVIAGFIYVTYNVLKMAKKLNESS